MESQSLLKLRKKLADISANIEDAEDRTSNAKTQTIEAKSRRETLEIEIACVDRRMTLVKEGLEKANNKKFDVEDKLSALNEESDNIDQAREELERNENAEDEKIQMLEGQVKTARQRLEESQSKLREHERKAAVLKRDIDRATSQGDALEQRIQVLEDTIAAARESLAELEEREGQASTLEERHEDEQLLLQGQLKEAEVAWEAAERSLNTIERTIRETDQDIELWVKKREKLAEEMQAMDNIDSEDED